ncbi:Uma2 family endonuclease [Nostoc sp. MG11]|uniref:Uma2 family endonuclease n=1 Tax=Nostoc sp. MG11 TaxID=2721166 RepID=UPI001868FC23|nr:Uma2 family endonuclease [Nostoc sp. MG11]
MQSLSTALYPATDSDSEALASHRASYRIQWGTYGVIVKRAGSLTLTRDDLERGAEPDSSYYIQNESLVRDKENIDIATDPPPDLVLEIEYSRSAIDKFKLYAAMGVPEFWRYNGSVLRLYALEGGQYSETQTSPTFTPLSVKEIPRFMQQAKKDGEIAATRAFRAWVRQKISGK